MDMSHFITIGENIHCTRIVLAGGKSTVELPDSGLAVTFTNDGQPRTLAIPADWGELSPAYGDGKVKHIALAVHQATRGDSKARRDGEDYLVAAAQKQIDAGADFLDVNVDEYSNDPSEQVETMRWLAGFLSQRVDVPLSIDSSRVETLAAGLEACRKEVGPPMVNSVSLERTDAIDTIRRFDAHAVVSASGKDRMPADATERLANFEQIVALLDEAGMPREQMHLDPLVLPISTDPGNGTLLLEATAQARKRFDGVHLTGGFSNVSFGMPRRNLLNTVFIRLCVEAGADSGIINPIATPPAAIAELDEQAEPFRLARAFLTGKDMFGAEFIAAHRDGKLDAAVN